VLVRRGMGFLHNDFPSLEPGDALSFMPGLWGNENSAAAANYMLFEHSQAAWFAATAAATALSAWWGARAARAARAAKARATKVGTGGGGGGGLHLSTF